MMSKKEIMLNLTYSALEKQSNAYLCVWHWLLS